MACEARELAAQSRALSATYAKLSAIYEPGQRKLLSAAEHAWEQFREADCESEGAQDVGGPLGIVLDSEASFKAACLSVLTHERVLVLKQRIEEERLSGRR